jgi:hypothetical protein
MSASRPDRTTQLCTRPTSRITTCSFTPQCCRLKQSNSHTCLTFTMGSVHEGTLAVQHTDMPGTRITDGLLLAKVYRNSDGSYLGGFACEYVGKGAVEETEFNLREAMQQLFARRFETMAILSGSSKVDVKTDGRDCNRSAYLVVARIVDVLEVKGGKEAAPKVRGIETLEDFFWTVGEGTVTKQEA